METQLKEHYRLIVRKVSNALGQEIYEDHDSYYMVIPVKEMSNEELIEVKQLSDFMFYQGEGALLMPTRTQDFIASYHDQQILVFKLLKGYERQNKMRSLGEQLAIFHQKGASFPYSVNIHNRYGKWREMWTNRLEQLEKWCFQRMEHSDYQNFERTLFETFPYYLGMTENAIQYIADSERDGISQDLNMGTICRERITANSISSNFHNLPLYWVIDHPARDLAEWIRFSYWNDKRNFKSIISSFFHEYERIQPINKTTWRLLYGRLLFPLNYFETVEGYYMATSHEQKQQCENKFYEIINRTSEYENLLTSLVDDFLRLPAQKLGIPKLEWLTSK